MNFHQTATNFWSVHTLFGFFVSKYEGGIQDLCPFFDNHHVTAYDGVAGATTRMLLH